MEVNQLPKLRLCGRQETYSTARHHLGFYNNVALTANYAISSSPNSPLETIVFAALRHVIAEQPILSAIPVNEDKSCPDVYFARLPEIDLRACVEFHTRKTPMPQGDEADEELDQLLREQHGRNFKTDVELKPYWRLAIISSPETAKAFSASWIFHHALSDGASAMLFHQSFLEGLNTSTSLHDISPIVTAPSTVPLPSLEALHPMTTTWPFFLRAIAGSLLPTYFAPRPANLWTGSPISTTTTAPVPAHTTTITLSPSTTRAFAAKCRAEKTTVTATLSALLAAALSSTVAPAQVLKIDHPISLRPFLSLPESQTNQIGNAISALSYTFPATTTTSSTTASGGSALDHFSWATSRDVKTALVSEVAKRGVDNPFALLKYVDNMHDFFSRMLGQQRQVSGEVSNLGVWRGRDTVDKGGEREWTLGRMVFSQSVNRAGPPISVSAVTGGDGALAMSFNWAEGEGSVGEGLGRVPVAVREAVELLVR